MPPPASFSSPMLFLFSLRVSSSVPSTCPLLLLSCITTSLGELTLTLTLTPYPDQVSVPPPEVDVWRQRNGEDPRSAPPSPFLSSTKIVIPPSP